MDNSTEFIKLTAEDIKACAEIYLAAFSVNKIIHKEYNTDRYYGRYICESDKYAYGIKYDGRLAGCMTAIQLPGFCSEYTIYIDTVAVHPDFQGMGLGSRMLSEFLEKIAGDTAVGLNTYRDSGPYRFYEKLKFKDTNIAHLEHPYIDMEERISHLKEQLEELRLANALG